MPEVLSGEVTWEGLNGHRCRNPAEPSKGRDLRADRHAGEGKTVPLGQPLIDTLERMGCGGVLLDEMGYGLLTNPVALRLLRDEVGPPSGPVEEREWLRNAIKRLLRSSSERFTLKADAWVTIHREDKRDLALHAVPIGEGDVQARTMVILVDLSTTPQPRSEVLEKLFGLTAAEARLAIQIGRGDTPADIALENGVSIATVRSPLASVFAKTQTSRQAELVALLARVAILP
jgi:DNA-binding CsgD family transcriptional regulator